MVSDQLCWRGWENLEEGCWLCLVELLESILHGSVATINLGVTEHECFETMLSDQRRGCNRCTGRLGWQNASHLIQAPAEDLRAQYKHAAYF